MHVHMPACTRVCTHLYMVMNCQHYEIMEGMKTETDIVLYHMGGRHISTNQNPLHVFYNNILWKEYVSLIAVDTDDTPIVANIITYPTKYIFQSTQYIMGKLRPARRSYRVTRTAIHNTLAYYMLNYCITTSHLPTITLLHMYIDSSLQCGM
jgi:hypothetical protein